MAKILIKNTEAHPIGVQRIQMNTDKYSLQDKVKRPWFVLALETGQRIIKDGK